MSKKNQNEVYYGNLSFIFKNFSPLIIPSYQRGYAWEDDNIKDLLNDINNIKLSNLDKHFTGTIVLTKYENSQNEYCIVDGQQRLSSLFILIKSIYDKLKDEELRKKYIVIKKRYDEKSRLKSHDEFLENYIVRDNTNAEEVVFSHKRIKNAKNLCDKWIKNKSKRDLLEITKIIEEKLLFIIYTPKKSSTATAMFEIINNRGKDLSELEKIKNYFVYIATMISETEGEKHTLHDSIDSSWQEMLKYLSYADIYKLDDENSFLRFCFIAFFSANKAKYQNIYTSLRKDFFPMDIFLNLHKNNNNETVNLKINELHKFLDFLVISAKNYACLMKHKNLEVFGSDNKNINRLIKYLSCHKGISSIVPLYLSILASKNLKDEVKISLLEQIEKLNFRVYGLPKVISRSDCGQSTLYEYANKFRNNPNYNTNELQRDLFNFVNTWCPAKKIKECLTLDEDSNYNYENWNGLRYFLARYEEYLNLIQNKTFDVTAIKKLRSDIRLGDYLSVEHIWASANRTKFADKSHIAKRRLGNFILLELNTNISASNKDIEQKLSIPQDIEKRVCIIDKTSLLQAKELTTIFKSVVKKLGNRQRRKNYYIDQGTWIDDKREEKLIKFALDTWCFSEEKK